MTKKEFEDYKFSKQTVIKHKDIWYKVFEVDFGKGTITAGDIVNESSKRLLTTEYHCIKDIKEIKELGIDNKEFERWRAEKGGKYYYADMDGILLFATESNDWRDNYRYHTGNYFQNEEEFPQHNAHLLALQELKDCIRKHNGGWKPDWTNSYKYKYYFAYDHNITRVIVGFLKVTQDFTSDLYMKSEQDADAVLAELGEDKIKLALGVY